MLRSKIFFLFSIIILSVIAVNLYLEKESQKETTVEVMSLKDYHSQHIQPIFDQKCIACHSCYNSPCQLNLTSYEGLTRGASQDNLYDFSTFGNRKPTRLYVDAKNPQEWRKLGFFSVTKGNPHNLLEYLISTPPGIESGKQQKYDSEYSRACITSTEESELERFREINPAGRMPLGLPALTDGEIDKIQTWLSLGAPGPDLERMEDSLRQKTSKQILAWENFLNQKGLKEQIVSRYLYEHLFLATLYFEDYPNITFRLVRSRTRKGTINEVATDFPFSKPPTKFFYRLRPITNTLVHKTNIPFKLSAKIRSTIEGDFLKTNWKKEPEKMPAYDSAGSNPFKTFKVIPPRARYNFFLQHSNYFIMTFIKGPVCRGQTALNVINDHFWVLFLDPSVDPLIQSEAAYNDVAKQTAFPSKLDGDLKPLVNFRKRYWESVETKFSHLKGKSLGLDSLWQGNNNDPNANITVFRHYDSATVLHGLRGRVPKTVWVLDYHVFESIYYNLSAGYNVFGPLLHQVNSRLYMEVSRVASEDLFLSFLPQEKREQLRKDWNIPTPNKDESLLKSLADILSDDVQEKLSKEYVYQGASIKSRSQVSTKEGLLKKLILDYYTPTQTKRSNLHKESTTPFDELKGLSSQTARYLPDTIHLLIEKKNSSELYTLIHNKDHYNVAMMFFEGDRRRPEKDSVDIIKGAGSSYANFIIPLKESQISTFNKDLKSATHNAAVLKVLKKYGLSRSAPDFWKTYNKVSDLAVIKSTNERGKIDLNRYINL